MITNPYVGMRVCLSSTIASEYFIRLYGHRAGTIVEVVDERVPYPIKVKFDDNPSSFDTEVFDRFELDAFQETPEDLARLRKQLEEARDQERRRQHADRYL